MLPTGKQVFKVDKCRVEDLVVHCLLSTIVSEQGLLARGLCGYSLPHPSQWTAFPKAFLMATFPDFSHVPLALLICVLPVSLPFGGNRCLRNGGRGHMHSGLRCKYSSHISLRLLRGGRLSLFRCLHPSSAFPSLGRTKYR